MGEVKYAAYIRINFQLRQISPKTSSCPPFWRPADPCSLLLVLAQDSEGHNTICSK